VLGGYLILLITVSSVPDLQKKNGSESQRKSVSAVLKGKNIRGKKKQNKTKQNKRGREFKNCPFSSFQTYQFRAGI
jgi:hypothetical protein